MPVSSVFNDSEGLYRTTVCLVRKPHYSARQMRFGSRVRAIFFSQIRHRNALTKIAWEDDVQALGMAMSTVASEKNRELLLYYGKQSWRQSIGQRANDVRVARNFHRSLFLRIGNFLYFSKTNFCNIQKVSSILSIYNILAFVNKVQQKYIFSNNTTVCLPNIFVSK